MLGSQGKCALARGIAREKDYTGRTAEEVAEVIRRNLGSETKMFRSIRVLVAPPLDRPEQVAGCVIPEIQKVRHITRTAANTLVARQIACFSCLAAGDSLCPTCAALPPSWPKPVRGRGRGRAAAMVQEQARVQEVGGEVLEEEGEVLVEKGEVLEEEGEVLVEEGEVLEEEDQGEDAHREGEILDPHGLVSDLDRADAEEVHQDEIEEAGEQVQEPGEVYWAMERRGSYWPCQVVPLAMVPGGAARGGGRDEVWVRMFGKEEYCTIAKWSLKEFVPGSDLELKARTTDPAQMAAYNLAYYAKRGL